MLSRSSRLSRKEINLTKKKGRIYHFPLFSVLVLERNDYHLPRLAFVISKKISKKATQRNKIKRILSETLEKNLDSLKKGINCVILIKSKILFVSKNEIEKEIMASFTKIGLK